MHLGFSRESERKAKPRVGEGRWRSGEPSATSDRLRHPSPTASQRLLQQGGRVCLAGSVVRAGE